MALRNVAIYGMSSPQGLVTHRDQPDEHCGVERRESWDLRDNIPVAINERNPLGILPLIGALVIKQLRSTVTLPWHGVVDVDMKVYTKRWCWTGPLLVWGRHPSACPHID